MIYAFIPALALYIGVGIIWGIISAVDYSEYRTKKNARTFLVTPIWPLVALFWVLRLAGHALRDAFREDRR